MLLLLKWSLEKGGVRLGQLGLVEFEAMAEKNQVEIHCRLLETGP